MVSDHSSSPYLTSPPSLLEASLSFFFNPYVHMLSFLDMRGTISLKNCGKDSQSTFVITSYVGSYQVMHMHTKGILHDTVQA